MKFTEIQLTRSALNEPENWMTLRMPAGFERGLVSVIVPTFNRSMLIGEAIDSVLRQTYRPIQLLIVDDGSSDETLEVVRGQLHSAPEESGFSAIYIRQPNRGASAARNQGLMHSHGEFIQYLDSDDVLVQDKLRLHVAALQSDERLDFVWSRWLVLPGESLRNALHEANCTMLAASENLPLMTDQTMPWEPWPTLTRRRFLVSSPLWNEHVSRWDDWEFALRQMANSPLRAYSPVVCCIQREHGYGRRFDFDFDPAGVELGLKACREALSARVTATRRIPFLNQLIADRYWEVGIEALNRGTSEQAREAFHSAMLVGDRLVFCVKAAAAWLGTKLLGMNAIRRVLVGGGSRH